MHRLWTLPLLLWIGLIASGSLLGQDADCDAPLSPKVQKLVDKGTDKRKYDAEKRRKYLEAALEENEQAWPAVLALGQLTFRDAQKTRNADAFVVPREWMRTLHDACPFYSPDIPYILGAIAYATGDYDGALNWFDRFLRWESVSGRPLTPRDLKRVPQVEGILPELRFLQQYNAHPDAAAPRVLSEVATRDGEYLPTLSADGTLLFFTRAGQRKAKGDLVSQAFEEFSWARRMGPSHPFDSGEALESPFNRSNGYGGASISIDNRSMYLAIKTPATGNPENIDLYATRYELLDDTGGERVYLWSDPQPLDVLNPPDGWESQPAISPDGRTLYFAAVHPGTTEDAGGNPTIDILASERLDNGQWSAARLLPAPVNGTGSDKAPFLHPDGRTLYFASNRNPGGGGYDIWMTQRDSTASPFDAGAWSDPVNLGAPLNTGGDEHGLVISTDGSTAYFATRRPGTQGLDILTWSMPEDLRPRASVVVKGELNLGEGMDNTPVELELRYAQSRRAEAIRLDDDGTYATIVDLSTNEDVLLVAKAEGAAFSAGIVVDSQAEAPALVTANLTVRSVKEAGAAFEIEDIFYASGSAEVNRSSLLLLDLFAEYLLETGLSVEIGGHTDDVGMESDNLLLSKKRATAVRQHLISAGVPKDRLTARGYGEGRPRTSNDTKAGRASNRRTEFKVTGE